MATPDPKTPTRAQLFEVLNNHELVRLFEKLFEVAGDTTPTEIEGVSLAVGTADSKATQAIDTGIQNEIKSKSNKVLLWLSMK
jgi:hypothetical protein